MRVSWEEKLYSLIRGHRGQSTGNSWNLHTWNEKNLQNMELEIAQTNGF